MTTAHDFSAKTIDGKDKSLADYRGKALLVVNVAYPEPVVRNYASSGLRPFDVRGRSVRLTSTRVTGRRPL